LQCIAIELKKLHLHIAVYCMAATILVTTTGLSVHHLYCYCKGEMVTTLYHPDETCGMMQERTANSTCCQANYCDSAASGKKHHCTDCSSEFVRLDAKYLPSSFLSLKTFDFVAPQKPFFALKEFCPQVKNTLRWEQDLPPPPAGSELLPWIQSYLC
jgi:hypothetical protein